MESAAVCEIRLQIANECKVRWLLEGRRTKTEILIIMRGKKTQPEVYTKL